LISQILTSIAAAARPINAGCVDIGKDVIDEAHERAFGYRLNLDPEAIAGPIVRKSVDNFTHDGLVTEAPARPEPGYVYQRLLDNRCGDALVKNLRFAVFDALVPFVYRKCRPLAARFGNDNARCALDAVENCVSREELAKRVEFAKAVGLDYGEIDGVRDRASERLYLLDANKTAAGPRNGLDAAATARAMDLYCAAMEVLLKRFTV
jgi:hypothetical protein